MPTHRRGVRVVIVIDCGVCTQAIECTAYYTCPNGTNNNADMARPTRMRRALLVATAVLFLAAFVALHVAATYSPPMQAFRMPLVSAYTVYTGTQPTAQTSSVGSISSLMLLAVFCYVTSASAVLQLAWGNTSDSARVQRALRWMDYTVVAAVMLSIAALVAGITEVWTLLLLFAGYAFAGALAADSGAEPVPTTHNHTPRVRPLALGGALLVLVFMWGAPLTAFIRTVVNTLATDNAVPWFVYTVPVAMLLMQALMPAAFVSQLRDGFDERSLTRYAALSLVVRLAVVVLVTTSVATVPPPYTLTEPRYCESCLFFSLGGYYGLAMVLVATMMSSAAIRRQSTDHTTARGFQGLVFLSRWAFRENDSMRTLYTVMSTLGAVLRFCVALIVVVFTYEWSRQGWAASLLLALAAYGNMVWAAMAYLLGKAVHTLLPQRPWPVYFAAISGCVLLVDAGNMVVLAGWITRDYPHAIAVLTLTAQSMLLLIDIIFETVLLPRQLHQQRKHQQRQQQQQQHMHGVEEL